MKPFKSLLASSAVVTALCAATCTRTAQQSETWKPLFDGTSLSAWKGYRADAVPAGWKIANQELTKDEPVADIITREQFGDFELELEWKIGKAGNSGIFYRGIEDPDYKGAAGSDR